jgi:GNAT superfamily N-acetyltransferase
MPTDLLSGLSHEEKTEAWRQNLLKHGTSGRKRVLVAVSDAVPIGFVRVGSDEDNNGVGLVYLLYVLPEHWRHGVGTAFQVLTPGGKSGMAVEELSFIEPELGEVLVAHKINKVRHAAAPGAAVRDQVVGTSLVGHMRPTISQDESEHDRE